MYSILFLTSVSFLACIALTPLVRQWSERHGFVDRPNLKRKRHATPTPRTGGIAIALSYLVAVGLLLILPLNAAAGVNLHFALGLAPAAVVVFLIGLLDDLIGLPPWSKLGAQVLAAMMAYSAGVHVSGASWFQAPEWLALPMTVAWLVVCSNAFNLIDGMDGLATGVGLFAAFTTLAAAFLQNNASLALATAPLVGALLAFLRYNFNPASIFLGDCGSLTVGFLLGCFAALWGQKSATLLGMTAPLMALSVPLLDAGIAVVRRFVRRQPIFTSDRHHMHHRLLDRGLTPRQVALLLYGVSGIAAIFSLLQTLPHNRIGGLLLVVFCVAAWVGVQLVGYREFDTVRHLAMSGTFRHVVDAQLLVEDFERRVAVARIPEDVWGPFRDVCRELGCAQVNLVIDGRAFNDADEEHERVQSCTIRVPFERGYATVRYPARVSVRHAVAFTAIAQILQRLGGQSLGRSRDVENVIEVAG